MKNSINAFRKSPEDVNGNRPHRDRLRPLWAILFAILFATIASQAKSQELGAIESKVIESNEPDEKAESDATADVDAREGMTIVFYNGETRWLPIAKRPSSTEKPALTSNDRLINRGGRPRYAVVQADIANFDADSDPDGWIASVQLFDANDQPVVCRANATFCLTPRVPVADVGGFVNGDVPAKTWSSQLEFDQQYVATARLRLTSPFDRVFGWQSTLGDRRSSYDRRTGGGSDVMVNASRFPSRATAITSDLSGIAIRNHLGRPAWGELSVKISVPGEGVFQATSVVPMRRSVLVDSAWPYR